MLLDMEGFEMEWEVEYVDGWVWLTILAIWLGQWFDEGVLTWTSVGKKAGATRWGVEDCASAIIRCKLHVVIRDRQEKRKECWERWSLETNRGSSSRANRLRKEVCVSEYLEQG